MRRFYNPIRFTLLFVLAMGYLLVFKPMPVLASNITLAQYVAAVQVTNNGTVATNVSVPFTLNTTRLISDGYADSGLNNTCIQYGGSDVAFMPAYSGDTNWTVFVPSIGATTSINDLLYVGGSQNMAAKIRYFPGAAGMTVNDAATLEPASNWTVSISGHFSTGTTGTILTKGVALRIVSLPAGNITAYTVGAATSNVTSAVSVGDHVINITALGATRTMTVDGVLVSTSAANAAVTDVADNWVWFDSFAMPYVQYAQVYVNSTLKGSWAWQNAATFTDLSGNGHTATPSFRNSSSDADVSAIITSFTPVEEAQASSWTIGAAANDMISDTPTEIVEMYDELEGTDDLFMGNMITDALTAADIPAALFWFPFLYGIAALLGLALYKWVRSYLWQMVITAAILMMFSLATQSVLPFWTVLIFVEQAGAVCIAAKAFGW